jgi:large subunit ribosomal protein L19
MSSVKPIIEEINGRATAHEFPSFRVGDTVRVHVRIVEGDKERVQAFEGVVIRKRRGGIRSTFTVRKISYGVGVERTFPFFSPRVEKVDVLSRGRVRRARLYYLRERTGKAARIRERVRSE